MGSLFPDQGSNLGSLHWKCRILPTGPPGKSEVYIFIHEKKSNHFSLEIKKIPAYKSREWKRSHHLGKDDSDLWKEVEEI